MWWPDDLRSFSKFVTFYRKTRKMAKIKKKEPEISKKIRKLINLQKEENNQIGTASLEECGYPGWKYKDTQSVSLSKEEEEDIIACITLVNELRDIIDYIVEEAQQREEDKETLYSVYIKNNFTEGYMRNDEEFTQSDFEEESSFTWKDIQDKVFGSFDGTSCGLEITIKSKKD